MDNPSFVVSHARALYDARHPVLCSVTAEDPATRITAFRQSG